MQAIIKQQEQQLTNSKKDREQLCFIVDERTNELRNLKQKNDQLEQMIRNGKICLIGKAQVLRTCQQ
jgi:hypothetical protein